MNRITSRISAEQRLPREQRPLERDDHQRHDERGDDHRRLDAAQHGRHGQADEPRRAPIQSASSAARVRVRAPPARSGRAARAARAHRPALTRSQPVTARPLGRRARRPSSAPGPSMACCSAAGAQRLEEVREGDRAEQHEHEDQHRGVGFEPEISATDGRRSSSSSTRRASRDLVGALALARGTPAAPCRCCGSSRGARPSGAIVLSSITGSSWPPWPDANGLAITWAGARMLGHAAEHLVAREELRVEVAEGSEAAGVRELDLSLGGAHPRRRSPSAVTASSVCCSGSVTRPSGKPGCVTRICDVALHAPTPRGVRPSGATLVGRRGRRRRSRRRCRRR